MTAAFQALGDWNEWGKLESNSRDRSDKQAANETGMTFHITTAMLEPT